MSVTYDVGGVRLPRPFRIQKFAHFGFNVDDIDKTGEFYEGALGFARTDMIDLQRVPPIAKGLAPGVDGRLVFTRFSGDHHALIYMHRDAAAFMGGGDEPDLTTNQITWQVGSLREIVEAERYLLDRNVKIVRVGRDMPGGNWHVYFTDPDGHVFELSYGMEQIGWSGHSRPSALHKPWFGVPELPRISDAEEINKAEAAGVDLSAGHRYTGTPGPTVDVDGTLLPRPFSVQALGPVGVFSRVLDQALEFYTDGLGFTVTEEVSVHGLPVYFMRVGHEHHSLVLAPIELRERLGWPDRTTNMYLGVQVGSYRQLRAAITHLLDQGYERVRVPAEMHTGIDYAAHFADPSGHRIQIYYAMEHVGWDGRPRPAELRAKMEEPWPESIESDLVGEPFMGPVR
ncbi:VOC family protein [Streptomyces chartreusis]|uniref:VOC family protein n=1 Tax=Streptomyces chartreusis TaxID=1969 RepID=UPI0036327069